MGRRGFSVVALIGLIVALAAVVPAISAPPAAAAETTFTTVGVHPFTVPAGVHSITFELFGADGGTSHFGTSPNERGGRVVATMPVTPGETLQVNVGGRGQFPNGTPGAVGLGGFNGGGSGGPEGTGGGGATDVRRGACAVTSSCGVADRILVAGGGGGQGGAAQFGGVGGDASGPAPGPSFPFMDGAAAPPGLAQEGKGGKGGTQSAGGAGGAAGDDGIAPAATAGVMGSLGTGGSGGTGGTQFSCNPQGQCRSAGGGGGGGGYYGGGGGGGGDGTNTTGGGGGGAGSSFGPAGSTYGVRPVRFSNFAVFDGDAKLTYTVQNPPLAADDSFTVPSEGGTSLFDVAANDTDADNNLDRSSLAIVVAPTVGTASTHPSLPGFVIYTAPPGSVGTDSFSYRVCDTTGLCDEGTVTVRFNRVPVVVDDLATVTPNTGTPTSVVVDTYANDADPDGDDLRNNGFWFLDTAFSHGTVEIGVGGAGQPGDGVIRYSPDAGFVGTDSATYTVCDAAFACSSARIFVGVGSDPHAPATVADTAAAATGVAVPIDVLGNDQDADGDIDPTSVSVVSGPSRGSAQVDPVTGVVTYTAAPGPSGNDSFVYQVCDATDLCGQATVEVSVFSPPVANDDAATVAVNTGSPTSVVVDTYDNDTDADSTDLGRTHFWFIGDEFDFGTLELGVGGPGSPGDGVIRYSPDLNFTGTDQATYFLCDDFACDEAEIRIMVGEVGSPPTVVDDTATATPGQGAVIDVLANDSDPDGNLDPTSVTITTSPTKGTTSVNTTTGAITYTANTGVTGTDAFTYQACDTTDLCDTATITVSLRSPPNAVDDPATATPGQATVIDVLANDTDPDGNLDPATVTLTQTPAKGTTSVNTTTGAVTYTPDAGVTGSDAFSYRVCDTSGLCDEGTVTVSLRSPPSALDDPVSARAGQAQTIRVLDNDSDPDGNLDPTKVTITQAPTKGTATVDNAGVITYTPNANASGNDSVTYQVCDTTGLCDTATVTASFRSPPNAVDDPVSVVPGQAKVIDVLANDADPDGNLDPTKVTITQAPTKGSVSINPTTGAITYTPNSGVTGTDTFTYRVCDTTELCDEGLVTVTFALNPPVANDDSLISRVGVTKNIDVLANDADPDGNLDRASLTITQGPTKGTATVNAATQTITYTSILKADRTDTITYQVCDSGELCDTAVVTVSFPSLPMLVRTSNTLVTGDSLANGGGTVTIFNYGTRALTPLVGDWDDNGTKTIGTFENGEFLLRNSNSTGPPEVRFRFGDPRGYPVGGDFNGDGTDDVAVFRNGKWEVRLSTGATSTFTFGTGVWPLTVPVAGDWDGNGVDGIGLYTYSNATWTLRNTLTGANLAPFVFGTPNATYPVVGDWNADGRDTVGVRVGTNWRLRNSNSAGAVEVSFDFGVAKDLPMTYR